jgi:hypothetical protein
VQVQVQLTIQLKHDHQGGSSSVVSFGIIASGAAHFYYQTGESNDNLYTKQ